MIRVQYPSRRIYLLFQRQMMGKTPLTYFQRLQENIFRRRAQPSVRPRFGRTWIKLASSWGETGGCRQCGWRLFEYLWDLFPSGLSNSGLLLWWSPRFITAGGIQTDSALLEYCRWYSNVTLTTVHYSS